MPLFADYEPQRRGEPPPAGIATREATAGDVAAYVALRLERGDATEAEAMLVFGRLLARAKAGEAHVRMATVGEAVVGYGAAERLAHPTLPAGWYLGGVVVTAPLRRRGIGARLTRERLEWIAARDARAYYFVNSRNRASIDLHAAFGFVEAARNLAGPGLTFADGVGLLFATDLRPRGA